nr:PAMP-induced secreted peptide 2-like [Ipomoea batatas]
MAARVVHKSVAFFLIISILFIRPYEAEARPFTAAKPPSFQTVAAVKTGGPSSGGRGHSCFFRPDEARPLTAAKHKRFQNAIGKTFVAVKTAGPSPRGKGHRLTPTDQSFGEIMHSGPSPGANH